MARHLISLIDGTAVSASRAKGFEGYSNVYELAHLLQLKNRSDDGKPQVVFYTSGIGSQPDTWDAINLITGNTIQSQIIDQYTSICANYDFSKSYQTDKIYIFGFSRGAMAARALAGLISTYGLLHPRDIRAVPNIMDAWIANQSVPDEITLYPVNIEFVGIFDAVMGGLEWMSAFNPIKFPNDRLGRDVKNAVHILAIDENRRLFQPKIWSSKKGKGGLFKQIWMPGLHGDVGGVGSAIWGRIALLSMTFYIEKCTELALDPSLIKRKENNLRRSLDQSMVVIEPQRFVMKKKRAACGKRECSEYYHPIIDMIDEWKFAGLNQYDWKNQILGSLRFSALHADDGLKKYFSTMLKEQRHSSKSARVPLAAVSA